MCAQLLMRAPKHSPDGAPGFGPAIPPGPRPIRF